MAIRVRALLKSWFGRGKYPTEAQFGDFMDSFWHREEDKIPAASVENLPEQLNGKYNAADGQLLEKKTQKLTDDLTEHKTAYEQFKISVNNNLVELEAEDEKIHAELDGVHEDITDLEAADVEIRADITTLSGRIDTEKTRAEAAESALGTRIDTEKNRAETAEAALRETDASLLASLTAARGDIVKIGGMLKSGATLDQAKAALVAMGAGYGDLYAVATTLKTFLTATDTADATINTWQEIEGFLQGITDTDSLAALLGQLEGKITAAYNAAISSAVAAEKTRAETTENGLSGRIDAEKTRAQTAESGLGGRIDTEKTRAETAENGLSGRINTEKTRAEAAEAALGERITTTKTALEAADNAAADYIAALQRADTALQENLTAARSDIAAVRGMVEDLPDSPIVDAALSTTSANAVQNKVVTAALNGKEPVISVLPVAKGGTGTGTGAYPANRVMVTNGNGQALINATATTAEVNHLVGVTSPIQGQINGKEPAISVLPISKGGTGASAYACGDRVLILKADKSGFEIAANVGAGKLDFLKNVSMDIQTQLNAKEGTISVLPISKGGTGTSTGISAAMQTALDGKLATGAKAASAASADAAAKTNGTLTFSGGATGSFNGSANVSIAIPVPPTVDAAMSATSANPVQNKAVQAALNGKEAAFSVLPIAKGGTGNATGRAASAALADSATTAVKWNGKSLAVVTALPASPDANTIYFITE